MKAILVMEMPENCTECPLEMDVDDTKGDSWKGNICRGSGKRNADMHQKPDWCPLVLMPERSSHPDYCDNGRFDAGFNACLDAIERSAR